MHTTPCELGDQLGQGCISFDARGKHERGGAGWAARTLGPLPHLCDAGARTRPSGDPERAKGDWLTWPLWPKGQRPAATGFLATVDRGGAVAGADTTSC